MQSAVDGKGTTAQDSFGGEATGPDGGGEARGTGTEGQRATLPDDPAREAREGSAGDRARRAAAPGDRPSAQRTLQLLVLAFLDDRLRDNAAAHAWLANDAALLLRQTLQLRAAAPPARATPG